VNVTPALAALRSAGPWGEGGVRRGGCRRGLRPWTGLFPWLAAGLGLAAGHGAAGRRLGPLVHPYKTRIEGKWRFGGVGGQPGDVCLGYRRRNAKKSRWDREGRRFCAL